MAQRGNPFYIDPMGGYGGSIVQGLSGLGQVLGQRQQMKQQEAEKQQLIQEAQEVFSSNDPNRIAEFSLRQPQMAEQVSKAVGFKSDATKRNMVESMGRILAGENPEQVIVERAQMVQEQGGDPINTLQELDVYRQDPQGYMQKVQRSYALLDPQGFTAYRQAMAAGQPELTGTQKEYQAAKADGFEGTFLDYQKALKGGPDSDVRTMMLQTQLLDLQDRIGERQRKEDSLTAMEDKKAKSLIKGIDSVVEEVDKAVKLAKEGTLATGIPGAITSKVPGSPAYNLRNRLVTVKANLGFDKLQQMRDSSPTGGALGSITDRELDLLQATLTNLDPNMGDEELIAGLEKVKKHYDTWRDAVTSGGAQKAPSSGFTDDDFAAAAAQAGVSVEEFRRIIGQ